MSVLSERMQQFPKQAFLLVGIGLAALYFLNSGMGDEEYKPRIQILQNQIEQDSRKLEETISITQNKQKFQEEMERVSQTFRAVLDYLPRELDVQDLLKKIYSEARSAGVELVDFKPKDIVLKDFYDEIPIQIKIKGTYIQLVTFLANISKIPRIINTIDVEITTPTMVDGYPHMQMSSLLIGYRYKEGANK